MNIFAFDIETIPDVHTGRRLYGLDGLGDAEVGQAMFALRQQESGDTFLKHHLQRIVAISVALRAGDQFRIWSLGNVDALEPELIRRFFDGIDKYTPTIVSWNGGGFDLPVLHYRAMLHGIAAPRYWETGGDDQAFRWNNYLNRFHERHTDLMDVLSAYQARAGVRLDDMATLLGLPGKLGMDGSQVWSRYLAGGLEEIRDYCETDVLNTYLIYLRFELVRGHLDATEYERECALVRETLRADGRAHLQQFLSAWRESEQAA